MIYFFPSAKTLSSRLLSDAGVADLLDLPTARDTSRGPGDTAGLLVNRPWPGTADLRYDPDRQHWQKRDPAGKCWIGRWIDDSDHVPARYAREDQFDGDRINLADGSQWIVPRIREFRETDQDSPFSVRYCLPRSLAYDSDTGAFTAGDVVPRYRAIADEAVEIGSAVHQQLIGNGSAALEQSRIDRFAGAVIRLNYRLDVPELGLLQLLDETTLPAIVRSALHIDWFAAALKKRIAARHFPSSNTSGGDSPPSEAAPTPTPPPSASV